MKKTLSFLLTILAYTCFAQQGNPKTSGKKIDFKNINVIAPTDISYKTLEIRYKEIIDKTKQTILLDGKEYKYFSNKKEAIDAFEKEKQTAEKVTIYFVDSAEKNKRPEVMTIKITKSTNQTP